MKSRMRFTLCVALATTAAGVFLNADVARAQSSGNGYSVPAQAPQKKKSGLLYRLFSRKKSKPQQPAVVPQQQQPWQQTAQTGGARRQSVQELLEAKFRAEGREVPPLTLEQLAQEQGLPEMQMPQTQQMQQIQQPQQQQYQAAQQQQQNYAAQPNYAAQQNAAGYPSYGQPQQPVANTAPAYTAAPQNVTPPAPEKPKRGGFRGFLSRLNPFRRKEREQVQPATLPSNAPGQYQATPQQQYAQQPHNVYQPPQAYSPQQQVPPNAVANQMPFQRPQSQQPQQQQLVTPTTIPRPFPGVPRVAAQVQKVTEDLEELADEADEKFDFAFEEELPTLAETPAVEEPVESQAEFDPFAEDSLPELAESEIEAETTPASDEGFRPTEQPKFEEPIVKSEESQVAEETQVATDESTSPYTGESLDGGETDLPKLQPVPTRNDYIHLDQLNAGVDSEALRREKRRLLLLSRPELSGLKGFCPVTLKNDRDLVDAKPEFEAVHDTKVYQLSSAEAKAEFERAPEEYAPSKGGIDVVKYTLGAGEVEGTLEFAAWYRGRLYLFSSAVTYDAFMRQPKKFAVEQASAESPEIKTPETVEE
ncbi:YHS domain protein [Symmachiella dynata]|uniref:YHS domain protein n=1 Tax=Symmachiella dynata TaxID=2527995 RepID=A0A517ZKA3_9PLAN|nr:hypothetical protein [Symmachiella dynata]QDU42843.1 YHS domain protein [Symmachiella dynata]